MTYGPTKIEVATSNSSGGDAFTTKYKNIHYLTLDLGVKVIRNVAQYPLYHVTYATAKFEEATSNSLGDAFKKKYIMT